MTDGEEVAFVAMLEVKDFEGIVKQCHELVAKYAHAPWSYDNLLVKNMNHPNWGALRAWAMSSASTEVIRKYA